ncbi:MAG: hypothetical protein JWP32_169 [Schumannella sp.]|nr:hypothetical protein [Schumannella sp.]
MIIIWQRWGILAVLFVPLGVGIGYLLKAVLGVPTYPANGLGALIGVGFIVSAAAMWLVVQATVGKIIDKPKPAFVYQQLAEPIIGADGAKKTHQAVPVTDPESGQQPVLRPAEIPAVRARRYRRADGDHQPDRSRPGVGFGA